jgi:hypothetical protein
MSPTIAGTIFHDEAGRAGKGRAGTISLAMGVDHSANERVVVFISCTSQFHIPTPLNFIRHRRIKPKSERHKISHRPKRKTLLISTNLALPHVKSPAKHIPSDNVLYHMEMDKCDEVASLTVEMLWR